MKQYEIWWAVLPSPIGRRPVLLLSRDPACEYLSSVLVVEIITTIRSIPQEVALGPREGLPRRCVANFDNLHAIPRAVLKKRIGALRGARIEEARHSLGHALGWPELVLAAD